MAPTPETVKFFVEDQNANPIVGALVRVFNVSSGALVTQQYSALVGADAVADVTLNGDDPEIEYTIRLSKTGVAFDGSIPGSASPQLIQIFSPVANSPTGTNNFSLKGQTFTRPVATDLRLCRCSGFFRDGAGRPLANLDIKIINQFKPAVVEGDAVLGERLDLRTDSEGFAQVDLFRHGKYCAWVDSIQATDNDSTGALSFPRSIVVPNSSSANLVSLLLPYVESVVFNPPVVSLSVGDRLVVFPTLTASDGQVLSGAAIEDVTYACSDLTVAGFAAEADKIVIEARSAGTAQISVTRLDQTIVTIPDTGITGSPLLVTVT